jgi:hypothetical protein
VEQVLCRGHVYLPTFLLLLAVTQRQLQLKLQSKRAVAWPEMPEEYRTPRDVAFYQMDRRLKALWHGCVEPFALWWLLWAAGRRLNAWGLLYVLAVGALRYSSLNCRLRLRGLSILWWSTRMLLATSICSQYLARLSMPPSVWPRTHLDGRPWILWGHDFYPIVSEKECERLGHPNTDASGLVCYAALDGGLSTNWLCADFVALLACLLLQMSRETVSQRHSMIGPTANGPNGARTSCPAEEPEGRPPHGHGRESVPTSSVVHTPSCSSSSPQGTETDGADIEAVPAGAVAADQPDERVLGKKPPVGRVTSTAVGITSFLVGGERWVLRLSHPTVLLIVVGLACAQNISSTQGIISLAYLLISLGAPTVLRAFAVHVAQP